MARHSGCATCGFPVLGPSLPLRKVPVYLCAKAHLCRLHDAITRVNNVMWERSSAAVCGARLKRVLSPSRAVGFWSRAVGSAASLARLAVVQLVIPGDESAGAEPTPSAAVSCRPPLKTGCVHRIQRAVINY